MYFFSYLTYYNTIHQKFADVNTKIPTTTLLYIVMGQGHLNVFCVLVTFLTYL